MAGMYGDASMRAASTSRAERSKWYRAVTPHVAGHDRDSIDDWRRAYDNRFMSTSMNRMHQHVGECVEQVHRTHAEKQAIYRQHQLPNLTWMDLRELTHERSIKQRQPAYYGDVGGPPRIGVISTLKSVPLGTLTHNPRLNLGAKSCRGWGHVSQSM
eukprot:TRINITY_DN33384_c2_g1_i1.p1 TRINITY_DN33384_c2_g1~~TRINITY_DN33384_c2_g1_i1.p1  ORF type:complete len:157 (-),score=7.25 TRINITY_DN33384_c2_g1_i1:103-573(-)